MGKAGTFAVTSPYLALSKDSLAKRPRQPEADDVGPIVCGVKTAAGGAEEARIEVPGTTAKDTVLALSSRPGRAVGRRIVVIVVPTIRRPFPHVAVHLVEAPRVGMEKVDRHGFFPILFFRSAAIPVIAIVIRLPRRDRMPPPERCVRAGPRHIFSFRLAQQAIALAGLGRQPGHVCLGIFPRYIDHRTAHPAPAFIFRTVTAAPAVRHTGIPFIEGYCEFPHRKL